jgi:hypothetical protein
VIHTDPVPGDVGLTRIRGPIGKFIEVGQWINGNGFKDYEHAFLVLPDEQLIEAEPGGARIAPLAQYEQCKVVYACPATLTDDQREVICAAAHRYVGVPYSFADYLAIAVHRFHIRVPRLRRYVATSRHMICSQLVDRIYLDAGVRLFTDNRWPGYVTPLALYELLAKEWQMR